MCSKEIEACKIRELRNYVKKRKYRELLNYQNYDNYEVGRSVAVMKDIRTIKNRRMKIPVALQEIMHYRNYLRPTK